MAEGKKEDQLKDFVVITGALIHSLPAQVSLTVLWRRECSLMEIVSTRIEDKLTFSAVL